MLDDTQGPACRHDRRSLCGDDRLQHRFVKAAASDNSWQGPVSAGKTIAFTEAELFDESGNSSPA